MGGIADKLADAVSHRAQYGMDTNFFRSADPFLTWVIELGKREGEWLRLNAGRQA